MRITLAPGAYIVAVSGGVDSVVLLDMLVATASQDVKLVVAHLDHGIRPDSDEDAQLVQQLAAKHNLVFELERAELGGGTSEAIARKARYLFLAHLRHKHQAQAIITAHHRDDVFETAVLNLLRGTGRRGLSSLRSHDELRRPLLGLLKQELVTYAKQHQLSWREDTTNQNQAHLRNWVRHELGPRFSQKDKQAFLELCDQVSRLNQQIDSQLAGYLNHKSHRRGSKVYQRFWFNMLPHSLAKEVVHYWLAQAQAAHYDQAKIDYIASKLKTLRAGRTIQVSPEQSFVLTKRSLRLQF